MKFIRNHRHSVVDARFARRGMALATSCSLFALVSFSNEAFAQAAPKLIDENGIDQVNGEFSLVEKDLHIGPQDGGMILNRIVDANADQISHNWLPTLTFADGGTKAIASSLGINKTFHFKSIPGGQYEWVDLEESGEKLVTHPGAPNEDAILTDRNGTTTQYTLVSPDYDLYVAKRVKYTNGYEANLSWLTNRFCTPDQDDGNGGVIPGLCSSYSRIQSVRDNKGYQIKFNYQHNAASNVDEPIDKYEDWARLSSATAINMAVERCDDLANVCNLSQGWPTVQYTRAMEGLDRTLQVTQPGNRVWKYKRNYPETVLLGGWDNKRIERFLIKRPDSAVYNYELKNTSGSLQPGDHQTTVSSDGVITHYDSTYTYMGSPAVSPAISSKNVVLKTIASGATSSVETTTYRYNLNFETLESFKRITKTIDTLGNQTLFSISPANGRLLQKSYPEGNAEVFAYDARGNVVQKTFKPKVGSGLADIVVTAGYDASCSTPAKCNKPNWTRDGRGNQTDFQYDSATGLITSITAPAGVSGGIRPQQRFGYSSLQAYYKNAAGILSASGLPISFQTSFSQCQTTAFCTGTADESWLTAQFGAAGTANNLNLTASTIASGNGAISATSTFTYDQYGNLLTVDGPLAGVSDTTKMRYDMARRLVGLVMPDPDGAGGRLHPAVRNTYDGSDRITKTEMGTVADQSDSAWAAMSAIERRTFAFDGAGRLAKSTAGSGSTDEIVTQYSYDALGRVDCTAQRMNSATFGSLPASACTLATNGSHGPDRITKMSYDAEGRVTKLQAAYGTAQQADEATTRYTTNGEIDYVIDAENNRTDYSYDGHDRLVKTQYPVPAKGANAASATDYEQLTLDANGNVTSRRLRDGQTVGYTYDNLNRVTSYDQPVPGAYWDLAYEYDLLGRLKKATGNGWAVNAFTYDALGRLTVEQNYNNSTHHAYDAAGRQTRLTWHDGFYVDYDHDVTGNVTAIRENGATSGVGVLATYAYDNLGRRTSITRGNGTVTSYGYDGVSRLASLTQDLAGTAQDLALGFSYNPASQIASNTRSNDVYAWGGHYNVDRSYTSNGLNQLTAAGSTALGYDGRGNLTSSGSNSYGYTIENRLTTGPGFYMAYEPTGERILGITAGSTDTRFAWSGNQMITEIAAPSWQVLRRYVPGPGVDEPIVWYEGAGTSDRRWLHADERGSIVGISNSAGAMININRYDEYGIPAAGNIGRFGYTGQAWIPELGMWYYKARMYSPTLGRFMQTDPIGYDDGMNWYNYVGGDPVNANDPSGLQGGGQDIVVTGNGRGPSQGLIDFSNTPNSWQWADIRDQDMEKATADLSDLLPADALLNQVTAMQPDPTKGKPLYSQRMTEEERDKAAEEDYKICRIVNTRECWASAAERDAARTSGRPVPPLQTGLKGGGAARDSEPIRATPPPEPPSTSWFAAALTAIGAVAAAAAYILGTTF